MIKERFLFYLNVKLRDSVFLEKCANLGNNRTSLISSYPQSTHRNSRYQHKLERVGSVDAEFKLGSNPTADHDVV